MMKIFYWNMIKKNQKSNIFNYNILLFAMIYVEKNRKGIYLAWEDVFDEFDFLDDVVDMPNGFRSFSLKDKSWSPIDVLCCDKL